MNNVEILVATVSNDPNGLYKKMNIKSDAVISCQGQVHQYEEIAMDNKCIKIVKSKTIGVGKNRNMALIYASGDYLLFSDDDVVFYDDYENVIREAFSSLKNADFIIFNFDKIRGNELIKDSNTKIFRLRSFNSLHYGTVRLAVKRSSLLKINNWFSMLYGGGCNFSNGEDSLFILEMLRKRLVGYRFNKTLGTYDSTCSTWFKGYTAKFFYDKGVWLKNAFPRACHFYKYYFGFKFAKESQLSKNEIVHYINSGIKGFKYLSPYNEVPSMGNENED